MYGRALEGGDMYFRSTGLTLMFLDDKQQTVRMICEDQVPFCVNEDLLSADIYVFTKLAKLVEDCEILGWLTKADLIECVLNPHKHWYVVHPQSLVEMPTAFVFQETCEHVEWSAIWDYTVEAWECCGCNRYLVDKAERDKAITESERLDQIPKKQKGTERKGGELVGGPEPLLRGKGGVEGSKPLF